MGYCIRGDRRAATGKDEDNIAMSTLLELPTSDYWNEFREKMHKMVSGARIVEGLDSYRDSHHYAQAKEDAYHFTFFNKYPDRTGECLAGEIEDLLKHFNYNNNGYYYGIFDDIPIRAEITNRFGSTSTLSVVIEEGRILRRRAGELGINIRCWGRERP